MCDYHNTFYKSHNSPFLWYFSHQQVFWFKITSTFSLQISSRNLISGPKRNLSRSGRFHPNSVDKELLSNAYERYLQSLIKGTRKSGKSLFDMVRYCIFKVRAKETITDDGRSYSRSAQTWVQQRSHK